MFSGGSYDDVARWLENFLTAHAKRENLRAEVEVDAGKEREGTSYGAALRVGARVVALGEFAYDEVAKNRGALAWCAGLADRVRAAVRGLTAAA